MCARTRHTKGEIDHIAIQSMFLLVMPFKAHAETAFVLLQDQGKKPIEQEATKPPGVVIQEMIMSTTALCTFNRV